MQIPAWSLRCAVVQGNQDYNRGRTADIQRLVNALSRHHINSSGLATRLCSHAHLTRFFCHVHAEVRNVYPLRRIAAELCQSGFRPSLVRSLVSTTFGPLSSMEDNALVSAWRDLASKERKEAIRVWLGGLCSAVHGSPPARAPAGFPPIATPLRGPASATTGEALVGSGAGVAMAVRTADMRAEGSRHRIHAPLSAEG